MNGLLDGRVAIVSGVGPGLGRDISLQMVAHGARVVLVARRTETLEQVATEIASAGGTALVVRADLTVDAECDSVVAQALDRFGAVDVLVNNAHRGGTSHRFLDTYRTNGEVWRAAMEVNLWASLNMTHAAATAMVAAGSGSIIMIGTMAVRDAQPGQGPYATSKAALMAVTRTLAVELGPAHVRVNAVLPGYIDGPAVDRWMNAAAAQRGTSPDRVRAELVAQIPLGSVASGADVAGTVVWLASDLARPVTGQAVDVNGGQWM